MSASNWDRIQEIFFAAADLSIGERDAFLNGACRGDAGLRSEVESLLRADATGDSAIAVAIGSEITALLDDHASLVGTRMGPYRLLKEIGRGGMGAVYLGERDDEQFRKLVAIKVVKRGMDSTEVLARFRHERQILASLDTPTLLASLTAAPHPTAARSLSWNMCRASQLTPTASISASAWKPGYGCSCEFARLCPMPTAHW